MHFLFVLIYANPFSSYSKHPFSYYSQWYVYPYFNQNWNLFVPPPNTNYKLLVSFEDKGKQSVDIFNEILLQHQTNRFAGYSALLLAFSNSVHYFEKNTALQKELNGPVKNDLYFQIIEQSAKNYIQSTRNIKIDQLKLSLCVEDLPNKKMKVYYN